MAVLAALLYVVSYLWPVELLQDHLLNMFLAKITTHVMVFS